ncbi:MAG: ATP-binding protein [Candidatus Omnitrophica bacterium]|nr:ATP-binding protein [Candidatus Omnitrophota bacterium]
MRMSFCVRDQIRFHLRKRIEALEEGYRQNVGLIGPDGMGKTYLLESIFHSLIGQSRFIPVYFDAESVDYDNFAERWIGAMLTGVFLSQSVQPPENYQSLLRAAALIVPVTVGRIETLQKNFRKEKIATSVRELFSLIGTLSDETGKKVALLIDEFHAIEKLPANDPFVMMGREIMAQKNTIYIVASSYAARAKEIFRDKFSLLFGNFEIVEIDAFDGDQAEKWIKSRIPGKQFGATEIKFLLRLTGGNPQYLDILIDRIEAQVTHIESAHHIPTFELDFEKKVPKRSFFDAVYEEVFSEFGRIGLLFRNRIDLCSRMAKDSAPYLKALVALACGRRKMLGISTFIEKKNRETKKILDRLVHEEWVCRKGDFYILNDVFFRFWLREVFYKKKQLFTPEMIKVRQSFIEALERQWRECENSWRDGLAMTVEKLFKEFRNDVVEVGQKRWQCPQFSEIGFRPTNEKVITFYAKGPRVRWLCQVAYEPVKEEEIASFIQESKKYKKRILKKIMIAVGGIEQNAKLMAQEARIQVWDLKCFNALLDLYDIPKFVMGVEEDKYGSNVGTLAEGVYQA